MGLLELKKIKDVENKVKELESTEKALKKRLVKLQTIVPVHDHEQKPPLSHTHERKDLQGVDAETLGGASKEQILSEAKKSAEEVAKEIVKKFPPKVIQQLLASGGVVKHGVKYHEQGSARIFYGLKVALPAPKNPGVVFYAYDEQKLYIDSGSDWKELAGGSGTGDMAKSTYDTDNNGVVDNSEKLAGSTLAEVQDHAPKSHGNEAHSVAFLSAQSVQTQNMVSVNNSTGPISFIAGSNVTLSESLSVITINAGGGSQSVQTQNMVSLNNSTGNIVLTAGNNITLSQSASTITISAANIPAQTVQTQNMVSVNNSTGNIVFTAGNNITLSQSASTITISAFNQSVQTQNSVVIDGSSGSIVFTAGNNITLSQSASTITISAFNQSVQTQNSIIVNGSSGSVVFTAGNNITLSQSASTITISAANIPSQTVQTQNMVSVNGSTGSIVFTAGNNVTLSQSASTITISAFNQSVQTQNSIIINGSSGSIVFTAGNNVTLSQNASTITISAFNQSVQTQNSVLVNGSSGSIVFTAGNNITLSQNASTITISAPNLPTSFVQQLNASSGSVTLSASANITISNTGSSILFSVAAVPTSFVQQLDGSSGSLTLVAGNNISISNQANTISVINVLSSSATAVPVGSNSSAGSLSSRFALADHSHQGIGVAGVSGGNTSNSSGPFAGSLMFAGGNNITLSAVTGAGGQTITISALAGTGAGVQGISADGSSNANTIVFSNSNNVSFGMNGSTITASASQLARNWGSSGASSSWVSSAGTATNQAKLVGSITISPKNNANSVELNAVVVLRITTTGGHTFNWWRSNAGGQTVVGFPMYHNINSAHTIPLQLCQIDNPGAASAITYNLYHNGANSKTVQVSGLMLLAQEI